MSNYNSLKATINANIKTNGNQEITGSVLNSVLNAMVNTLGAGYVYAGVANPSSNPGSPDAKVFYIAATAGTYTNFGGLVVSDGEVAFLKWDTTWQKDLTEIATSEPVRQLIAVTDAIKTPVTITEHINGQYITDTGTTGNLAAKSISDPIDVTEGDVIVGTITNVQAFITALAW